MAVSLRRHQLDALNRLRPGSILCGGVGSGKSRVSLAYYLMDICKGSVPINGRGKTTRPKRDVKLYIITTARKRDTHEWEKEAIPFYIDGFVVDSWNNIAKYTGVANAFFIFDEQRVVGSGAWSKSFLAIAKNNRWIMLSATPGDVWMDYLTVFLANGFYRNKTDFCRKHVVYSRFAKYPKVERYINTDVLEKHRDDILVLMPFERSTTRHEKYVYSDFDAETMSVVFELRWNPYDDEPIQDAGKWTYLQRRVVNSDPSRVAAVFDILRKHPKAILFYNFDYELELLRAEAEKRGVAYSEYNGHKHEAIRSAKKSWLYLVQYTAGAEGWNCILTDTIIFFSQNYSYKVMTQASGRIDRLNTPFEDLFYYHIVSKARIDAAIRKALSEKETFNERAYASKFDIAGDVS